MTCNTELNNIVVSLTWTCFLCVWGKGQKVKSKHKVNYPPALQVLPSGRKRGYNWLPGQEALVPWGFQWIKWANTSLLNWSWKTSNLPLISTPKQERDPCEKFFILFSFSWPIMSSIQMTLLLSYGQREAKTARCSLLIIWRRKAAKHVFLILPCGRELRWKRGVRSQMI